MGKRKCSVMALLLAVSLVFTGCGQEMMDWMTDAVIEQAKEEAAQQTGERPVGSDASGEVKQPDPDSTAVRGSVAVPVAQYAYTSLNGTAKEVYEEVYNAMTEFEESVNVSTVDEDVLEQAFYAVLADHGEIFWVDGYKYTEYTKNDRVISMDFQPAYTMDQTQMQSYQRKVEVKVKDILSGISANASDYEKAKYVYETLASTVAYQEDSPNNQNILSVFLGGSTVCQGYASATQYLLSLLGVTCVTVSGTAMGTPHAWNLVCLDGQYYYMDTTWGSSSYTGGEGMAEGYVDYSYLAITSQELFSTHVPDYTFSLPVCNSIEDNYYVQEGLYFTEWNSTAIGEKIKEQKEQKNGVVSLKFSYDELYQLAVDYYTEEGHLWDYYDGNDSVYYVEDPGMHVLTIFSEDS